MDNNNFTWGGPVHRLLLALKIDKEPKPAMLRKILFFSLLSWIPLLILSLLESSAFNPELKVSLLSDVVVWSRFFVAFPMVFIAEGIIREHTGNSLVHFLKTGIIAENNIADYESLLVRLNRINKSKTITTLILIASYAAVLIFWRNADKENFLVTWLFNGNGKISIPGYWYYLVSAPLFQFFLYRLLWKFILWAIFLYNISKMNLNLYPTNPDMSAGLRFLGVAQIFFGMIGLAQSCVAAAEVAKWATMTNSPLSDYYFTIALNILISAFVFFLPMLLFFKKLSSVKLKGLMDYGVLASKYIKLYDDRWVKGLNPDNEQLLGTGDIQSLADLGNSYQVVENMKMIPMDLNQIVKLILLIAVPFLPLITFVIPLSEIAKILIGFFI